MYNQENINKLLYSLSKTKFRGSFHLNNNMKNYVLEKGFSKIESDAYDLITKRIAPKNPKNDGKQTPMRSNSHPVFIAQHACGCCCRSCLLKIHHIFSLLSPLNKYRINLKHFQYMLVLMYGKKFN